MGKKENALGTALQEAGINLVQNPTGIGSTARSDDLPAIAQQKISELFESLGGAQSLNVPFRTGRWDFTDGQGLYLEFDEFEHFNRERLSTLSVPWSDQLPWAAEYRGYCVEHGHRARTYGKFWTSPSTEKQFGLAAPNGTFEGNRSPRWKQRAFYDALKDAQAIFRDDIQLIRLSAYDQISGQLLGDLLQQGAPVDPTELRALIAQRSLS